MKIPETFRPKKSKSIESLLKKPEQKYNLETVDELLSVSEQFLEIITDGAIYQRGVELVRDLKYTLKDIEELSKKIKHGQSRVLGIYLSALINRVITEKDEVTLTLEEELDYIGMYLKKGTVIVEGNTNNLTGYYMEGGELIVKGKITHISYCFIKGTIIEGTELVKKA